MQHDSTMFTLMARVLHWLMATLIVAMIFIGVGMVASVSERHLWLVRLQTARDRPARARGRPPDAADRMGHVVGSMTARPAG